MILIEGHGLGTKKWYSLPFCIFAINYWTVACYIVVPIGLLSMFIMSPNRSMYLYSTLPSSFKGSTRVFMGFVVFEALIIFWNLGATSVSFVYWCAAVFQNLIWLDSLMQ